MFKDFVKKLQKAMNDKGSKLTVDGDLGPKTQAETDKYDFEIIATPKPLPPPPLPDEENKKDTPWYLAALQFKGKKETDPEFSTFMVPFWKKLFGMNLNTIKENRAAWCGLGMAVALFLGGVDYAKDGSLAKNWGKFGIEIQWKQDGIPKSAIVRLNHNGDCSASSGNHVAQANGDCAVSDLIEMKKDPDGVWRPTGIVKKDASIDLLGGNQSNTWKVSTFSASEICDVRWPKDVKDFPKPGPVLKSLNCTSKTASNETTR